MQLRYRIENAARAVVEFFEDTWFDRTRKVRTLGNVSLRQAGIAPGEIKDSELYVPARPANIRQALRETGIDDHACYHYVDLGSGKGRTLFVAAELPFRDITGVEFSWALHEQARANIRSFRWWKRRCTQLRSLHMNAKDFIFPDGRLVLYLFNPFGAETMQCVLDQLDASLRKQPRHAIVVLLWPKCGEQVARVFGMHLRCETRRHQIFESGRPELPSPN